MEQLAPVGAQRLLAFLRRRYESAAFARPSGRRCGAGVSDRRGSLQVLELVARGMSTAEAAHELVVTPATVSKHLEST